MTTRIITIFVGFALVSVGCGASVPEPTLAETTAQLVQEPTAAPAEPAPTVVVNGEVETDPERAAAIEEALNDGAIFDTDDETASRSSDDADDEAATATPTQTPAVVAPVAGDRSGEQTGLLSSAASPAPAGERFLWNLGLGDRADIVVHGLIRSESKLAEPGACLTIFYTATPASLRNGLFGNANILLGVRADGTYYDTGGVCETEDDAQAAGFGLPLVYGVVGAPLHKTKSILLEGNDDPTLESIVVGSPSANNVLTYIEPTILTAIPDLDRASPDIVLPSGPAMAGTTAHDVGAGDDLWDVTFQGIVVSEPAGIVVSPDVCVSVVGVIELASTASATTGSWTPEVDVIAGGLAGRPGNNTCPASNLEALGYRRLSRAQLTVGSTYHFAESFLVPADLVDFITTVVIDEPRGLGALQAFAANIIGLDQIEPATIGQANPVVVTDSEITSAEFSWTDPRSGITTDFTIHGLVQYDRSQYSDADCYAIVGTATPNAELASASALPDFSLVASGLELPTDNICDHGPLEDSGYTFILGARTPAEVPVSFYQTLQIFDTPQRELQAVIIGDRDGERLIFDAALIADIPPAQR